MHFVTETCRRCGGRDIVIDRSEGAEICRGCGMVQRDHIVDDRPDYSDRTFEAATGSNQAMSRLESIVMSKAGGKRLSKRYLEAVDKIHRMSAQLCLTKNILEHALHALETVFEAQKLPKRSSSSLSAAALYLACKNLGHPRTLGEVAEVGNVLRKEISRSHLALKHALEDILAPGLPRPAAVSEVVAPTPLPPALVAAVGTATSHGSGSAPSFSILEGAKAVVQPVDQGEEDQGPFPVTPVSDDHGESDSKPDVDEDSVAHAVVARDEFDETHFKGDEAQEERALANAAPPPGGTHPRVQVLSSDRPINSVQLVPRLCSSLHLPNSVKTLAEKVAELVYQHELLMGVSPQVQAAVSLYMVCFLFPRCNIDREQIAHGARVRPSSLVKCHKVLFPHWRSFIPKDIQTQVGSITLDRVLRPWSERNGTGSTLQA